MNRQQHYNYGATSTSEVTFSDRSVEFNSICDGIATNIYTITSSLKTLDNALKHIGTKKDNQGLRNTIHVTQLSTNQIASITSKDINKLKQLITKNNKQWQLQVENIEENFKETINHYYTLQKDLANKQKLHLLVSVSIENEHTPTDIENDNNLQQQQQQQLAREMTFEQDMMLEREARIKQIESDVLDVNQIMRELGSLVHAQTETIDTIENSIDYTAGNVEEATEQLIKASRYQNRYRRKLVYLVIIGLIIAAIIIGILVSELKK